VPRINFPIRARRRVVFPEAKVCRPKAFGFLRLTDTTDNDELHVALAQYLNRPVRDQPLPTMAVGLGLSVFLIEFFITHCQQKDEFNEGKKCVRYTALAVRCRWPKIARGGDANLPYPPTSGKSLPLLLLPIRIRCRIFHMRLC
jgi:hypothetical protein